MLTQAAGGNVSWKDGAKVFVKASGARLADALQSEVFVSLDLQEAEGKLKDGHYEFSAAHTSAGALRPSIETGFHVVLPQKIILHLHPVDVIARSVRAADGRGGISRALAGMNWVWLDYFKPGEPLAREIQRICRGRQTPPDVWILANHGIIVGAETVGETEKLLNEVVDRLVLPARASSVAPDLSKLQPWMQLDYRRPANPRTDSIALDEVSLQIARRAWVLYPDHAVFLGATGSFASEELRNNLIESGNRPHVIIVPDGGVLLAREASNACEEMLACYADVLLRISDPCAVIALTSEQISELICWEAEEYRKGLSG